LIFALFLTLNCLKVRQSKEKLDKLMKGLNHKSKFIQTEESVHTDSKAESKQEEELSGFQSLIKMISTYSDDFMHHRDPPELRKLRQGVLSSAFPKSRRDLAKLNIYEKRSDGSLTRYFDEPWRFCIYPFAEVNIMTFCDQNFMKVSPTRASQCKHLHCVNCCNHMLLALRYATQMSIVSEVIKLNDDMGFNKIKQFIGVDKL